MHNVKKVFTELNCSGRRPKEEAQWPDGWCNGLLLEIIVSCTYFHSASRLERQAAEPRRRGAVHSFPMKGYTFRNTTYSKAI